MSSEIFIPLKYLKNQYQCYFVYPLSTFLRIFRFEEQRYVEYRFFLKESLFMHIYTWAKTLQMLQNTPNTFLDWKGQCWGVLCTKSAHCSSFLQLERHKLIMSTSHTTSQESQLSHEIRILFQRKSFKMLLCFIMKI